MPIPYSYDLRKKVIDVIDEGMSKTETSRIFRISRNTINLSTKLTDTKKEMKKKDVSLS